MSVHVLDTLIESLIGISIPSRGFNTLTASIDKEALRAMMSQASGIRRTGSGGIRFSLCGRWTFKMPLLELELAPWDMAAGVLLVQEAGGIACDIKGGENYFTTGHIMVANPITLSFIASGD